MVARALAGFEDVWLEAPDVRELLEAYGIPIVSERVANDPVEAAEAARELGFPAVVKTAAAGAHKTETGGIALDLGDETAVAEAVRRIGGPVLVQPMVRGGAELLAGVVQDPVFGPLVAFGPGGIFAELIGDAGFRIAEVPVHHYHRAFGKSQFFNFRRLFKTGVDVMKLWFALVIRKEHRRTDDVLASGAARSAPLPPRAGDRG